MEDLSELKKTIADNLIFYRKQKGLTQLDIAEKLNYSDKAVSKWERAEAVPDVFILKQIADFYSIKLDDLLSKDKKAREKKAKRKEQKSKVVKIFVTALSCGLVWCLATALYILPIIIFPQVTKSWLVFVYALTINFILLVVFSCLWAKNIYRFFSISGLIWSLFLTICFTVGTRDIWLLLIAAVPLQVMVVIWFMFLRTYYDKAKQSQKSKQDSKQAISKAEETETESAGGEV